MNTLTFFILLIGFCSCEHSFLYTRDIYSKLKEIDHASSLNRDWPFYKCGINMYEEICPKLWSCSEGNCIPDTPNHWEFIIDKIEIQEVILGKLMIGPILNPYTTQLIKLNLCPKSEIYYQGVSYGSEIFLEFSKERMDALEKAEFIRIAPHELDHNIYRVYLPTTDLSMETYYVNPDFH